MHTGSGCPSPGACPLKEQGLSVTVNGMTRNPASPRRDPDIGTRPQRGELGSVVDWMFRNRHTGRWTIAQFPNTQLWIFLVTVVARWVVTPRGKR